MSVIAFIPARYNSRSIPEKNIRSFCGKPLIFWNLKELQDSNVDRKKSCIVEYNMDDLIGITVRDTSGNGNKGILIGDFSVKKEDRNIPLRRDSVMKTPKKGRENGAM